MEMIKHAPKAEQIQLILPVPVHMTEFMQIKTKKMLNTINNYGQES